MKTIYLAAAALLFAGSAAHAGNSIALDVGGHKVRVTMPSNCQSLSCLQVSGINLKGLKTGSSNDDDDNSVGNAPMAQPAPVATAPVGPAPSIAPPAPQIATTQSVMPAPAPVATSAPAPTPLAIATTAPIAADPAPAMAPPSAPAPVTQPSPVAAAPATDSPIGLWATEDRKGNVRIEPCGDNICGYAEKSGEKILINMKPKDSKWVGRIHDPEGGSNYDSTIALKGPNTLKVQGCAFGGLFCGGQTWKRVG